MLQTRHCSFMHSTSTQTCEPHRTLKYMPEQLSDKVDAEAYRLQQKLHAITTWMVQ